MKTHPIVLCIGGHDPTGGAGVQADIETVNALGGQAMSLITVLTRQDTHNIHACWPSPDDLLAAQLDTLCRDVTPDAVKIGLLGAPGQAGVIAHGLAGFCGPVVLDPVLAAGGGFDLGGDDLTEALREVLLPLASLVTPNRAEARRLGGCDDADAAAGGLLGKGVGAVLLTGADESRGDTVVNRLFTPASRQDYAWPRLPGGYHGSGCTLASACAVCLASGLPLHEAVGRAQGFSHEALRRATRPGSGQALPRRMA